MVNTMVMLRELTVNDLSEIAAVHIAAFPTSALTKLGRGVVERYYIWQLTGPHQVSAVGACVQDRLVGFYIGGTFNGAMEGFLRENRRALALAVLRRPWLLLTNPIFRQRLLMAFKILTKKLRRRFKRRKPASTPRRVPSFGVLAIAVDPAYQGPGIGQALMTEADRVARARGFARMELGVHVDNHQAIRFYEQSGWMRISQNGEWKGPMEKYLTPE